MSSPQKPPSHGLMSRIGYLLSRPTLEFQRLAQAALEPLGLIPPHMGVLSTLHFEGPQTQRALGVLLKVDPTTMVWLIDGLEKKRLVRRGEHPKDRRAHLVGLSSAGQAAFRRAAQALNHVEDEFLAPLSKKERDDLKRLLAKLFRSVPMQGIPSRYFVKKA